jgi:phosphoesterase RecJ-like protein
VTGLDEAVARVRAGQRFLVAAHANPDGDALGSMLATAHGLRALGKEVVVYDKDGAPARLAFLPGADEIIHRVADAPFDATLVHDCGDARLLGDGFPPRSMSGPILVLDHHTSERPFGDVSLRDPSASAVGVIVARLLRALGVPLSKTIAECLWCSLVEDTGWFRYAATDLETMRLAADCVAAGARPWDFALKANEQSPPERLKLLARVLDSLEIVGSTAILTLTRAMCDATGASADQADGFVGYARGLRGVEVGVMLYEAEGGVRVSLRSKGRVDVAAIAERFGGGGHRAAAGCFLEASLVEARAAILDALAGAERR